MRAIKFRLRIGNEILGYEQWYIGDGSNSHWEYLKVNSNTWRPDFIYHTRKDQYIGTTDKNKKEIYGGDILRTNEAGWVGAVHFHDGRFYLEDSKGGFSYRPDWGLCEIIGNIYQNPELLGSE
ncbi:hypothetical protein ES695_20305 [Candidatus Atribacteria bacterium 1244-E10-H5-B2]|nr:MAG: hypothetical protein ES695_20305 [Candidatus Atribacteria bacterium 1244-E10-H5-B2]